MTYGVLATFTFISGYFLGMKEIRNFKDVMIFYARRLISFYPLYVIACILLWYIGYIKSFRQCILTIIGLSGIFSPAVLTVWYLCMLMLFYLITPLVTICKELKTKFVIIVIIYGVMLLSMHVLGIDGRYHFYWFFYGMGILLSDKLLEKINYVLMILTATIFMVISINIGNEIVNFSFVSAACIVIFVINFGKVLEKTIFLPMLKKISYASMCAYLFHRPIYLFICITWQKNIGNFTIWVAYLVALPTVLLLCYWIQFFYDILAKNRLNNMLERHR